MKILGALLVCAAARCSAQDVREIVERAANAMRSDWQAAPSWSFVQRDVTEANGKRTVRTHRVLIVAGSDYYMLTAVDDKPLSDDQQHAELLKLKAEVERRSHEDAAAAQRRAEIYRKQREQNGALLLEFSNAFQFELVREEAMLGRDVWLLSASPRADYKPPNRTARILTGMRGRLWVDKATFHWARAEADVVNSVSILGFFARVLPGTHMELEMAPVNDTTWQATRFPVRLKISKLWMKSTQNNLTEYSMYRPNGEVLAELLRVSGFVSAPVREGPDKSVR
jgi:hypothetical protein